MKKLSVIGALLLTMVMATGCGSKVMTSKNGMTVETPESGWKVQENDAGTYILTKKNDSIMCMTGESSEIKLPNNTEEEGRGEGGKILESHTYTIIYFSLKYKYLHHFLVLSNQIQVFQLSFRF